MILLDVLKAFLPKDNHNKKTKVQIQKEKNEYERKLWELAEEYEEEDD